MAADLSHDSGVGLMAAFVAATALRCRAAVITADPDFRRLENAVAVRQIR